MYNLFDKIETFKLENDGKKVENNPMRYKRLFKASLLELKNEDVSNHCAEHHDIMVARINQIDASPNS